MTAAPAPPKFDVSEPESVWLQGERSFRVIVRRQGSGLLHRFYGETGDIALAKAGAFVGEERAKDAERLVNKHKRRAGRIRQAASKRALKASARAQAP